MRGSFAIMLSAYAPLSLMLEASEKSMAKSEIRRFLKEIRTKFPDVVPLMEKHESWALCGVPPYCTHMNVSTSTKKPLSQTRT